MIYVASHLLATFAAKADLLLPAHSLATGCACPKRPLGYLLKRPASLLGLPKRDGGHAVMGAPLFSAYEFAVKGQPNVRSHIIDLLLSRRPTAIPRLVMSVTVNSVEGVIRLWLWLITNVQNKTLDPAFPALAKSPTITNLNSSAAIKFKLFDFWVIATPLCTLQSMILGRAVEPVTGSARLRHLIAQATARFCFAFAEIGARCLGYVPAHTSALPDATVRAACNNPNGCKTSKGLSCQILGQAVHFYLQSGRDNDRKVAKGLENFEPMEAA